MAIQFICPSCGQPIEVDDELANELVTCPFCNDASTAPEKTDLTPGSPAVASPAATPSPPRIDYAPSAAPAPGSPRRWASLCGWISLACIPLVFVLTFVAASMSQEFTGTLSEGASRAEREAVGREILKSKPQAILIFGVGACVLPVAAIVLAVIAIVARAVPRWPAIATLCLMGVGVLLMCAGSLLGSSLTS